MAAENEGFALNYEDEEEAGGQQNGAPQQEEAPRGHYAGVHSSGFRDFLLRPELMKAIVDCGFEHPSAVQNEAIPQSLVGMDVLSQAKSGMGKTAVFVLSTLHQLKPVEGEVSCLVLAPTRELAFQIGNEYKRFTKYMPDVKTAVFYGGMPKADNQKVLKESTPNIVVGTPGRIIDLLESGHLDAKNVKFFVVDECDKMLQAIDMREQVQKVFRQTPVQKQVMMFSATMPKEIRPVCKKFMQDPLEIFIEDDTKLRLVGLHQYYVKLAANEKNRKLSDLLDGLEFNQVIVFVNTGARARELDRLLKECNFPSMHIHGGMSQTIRNERFEQFVQGKARILVSTNLFGRGMDIGRVNIVINYDFPYDDPRTNEKASDQYLHRVARAGRFGSKGLAISFISTDEDEKALKSVQDRFEVSIPELPEQIDQSTYM